jgi:hypothetical protein
LSLTSGPYPNSSPAPDNGVIVLQLIGTGVPVSITLQLPGSPAPPPITASLNGGNTLINGALYEFGIHVVQGETITVPGTVTLVGMFFEAGV